MLIFHLEGGNPDPFAAPRTHQEPKKKRYHYDPHSHSDEVPFTWGHLFNFLFRRRETMLLHLFNLEAKKTDPETKSSPALHDQTQPLAGVREGGLRRRLLGLCRRRRRLLSRRGGGGGLRRRDDEMYDRVT